MPTTTNPIDDFIRQHLEKQLTESIGPRLAWLEDAIVRLDERAHAHGHYHSRTSAHDNSINAYREALHTPSQSPKPNRHGHPWTHTEEQNLTTHIRLHIEEIARAHKRTPKAIAFKLMQIAEDYI